MTRMERPSARPRPTRSWVSATGASPGGVARRRPSWPSAAPSWSSSGTYSPILKPVTTTWDPATTTPASTQNVRSATTSANLKHSVTRSLSSLPPETTSALYRRHQHRSADDQTRAVTFIFELGWKGSRPRNKWSWHANRPKPDFEQRGHHSPARLWRIPSPGRTDAARRGGRVGGRLPAHRHGRRVRQ